MKNNFSTATRGLFVFNDVCFYCGKTINKGEYVNALHHIKKRVSSSPLNACPIHNTHCHLGNGKLHHEKVERSLLKKTLAYLLSNGYKLTFNDKQFMLKYKSDYESIAREK